MTKGKSNRRKALAVLIMVAMVGLVIGISRMDVTPPGGVADTLPVSQVIYDPLNNSAIASAIVDFYQDGILKGTCTTAATGIGLTTAKFTTNEKYGVYVHKTGYIPVYTEIIIPYNTANYDEWPLAQIDMNKADGAGDIMICDVLQVEKSTSEGSPWYASSTTFWKLNGWVKVVCGTDKTVLGGSWFLPQAGEVYPDQRTYLLLKMNQTATGVNIPNWNRGIDELSWYIELEAPLQRLDNILQFGVINIPFQVYIPAGTETFKLTPYIWSDQSPTEMAQSTPDSTRVFSVTGTAQYLNSTSA